MKVHWTERARWRLRKIHDYLDEEAPTAARPTVERLLRRSRQISELPRAGRQVREYQQPDLREILERPTGLFTGSCRRASMLLP